MVNHYAHNVDITREPFYCSDCELHLADDGTELDSDTDTEDWHNAENILSTY